MLTNAEMKKAQKVLDALGTMTANSSIHSFAHEVLYAGEYDLEITKMTPEQAKITAKELINQWKAERL